MSFPLKVLTLYILSSVGVSCAATPESPTPRNDAVLLNADKAEIREAIRIFVRKDAGNFVIADPDSLTHSPNMVVHRRAQDYERQLRKLPAANLNYRLVSDGRQCWLIRHETSSDSPITAELLLPEAARCTAYSGT